MLVHLQQLLLHVLTVDIEGVPDMIHTQVMANQHIPVCWLLHPWHQVLPQCIQRVGSTVVAMRTTVLSALKTRPVETVYAVQAVHN